MLSSDPPNVEVNIDLATRTDCAAQVEKDILSNQSRQPVEIEVVK